MTLEDKELLLKDISARLPYGVICECLHSNAIKATAIDTEDLSVYYFDCDEWESIGHCKPYLRPMSSITDKEKEEIKPFFSELRGETGRRVLVVRQNEMPLYQDYLNAHFLDYRGLIPKGLALEAPEGMYKVGKE